MHPDLLLLNGAVLTMDPAHPRAEAVALSDGRIVYVGPTNGAPRGPATTVIDCRGKTVLPGFVESHLHLVMGGMEMGHLQLGGIETPEALAASFAAYGRANPDAPILLAQGASYDIFGRPATRADLDAIDAGRPIAMCSADHHTVWANTAALTAAGLLHGAPMPHGHEVVVGPDGLATGELREFEAFGPALKLGGEQHLYLGIATGEEPLPWPGPAQQHIDRAKAARGLAHCARHGVTTAINMDGNRYTLTLLQSLADSGDLTVRLRVPFHFKPLMDLRDLDRAEAMRADFNSDMLGAGHVKFFMDGVADSRTAHMLNDYPGHPGHRSEALFPAARFADIVTEVDRRGFQIAVHAIGDGAVRTTIDAMAAARQANGQRDSRHRIEHIELIDRADVPRLAALGITASVQPTHAPGAMDFPVDSTMDIIGWDRAADAYLCRDLAESGAPIAFASDWPVADISVLRGIKAALTRPAYKGGRDQRLPLMAVLHAYTAGGAWAAHLDQLTGTLRRGLAGDVVVLSGDIEATAPEAIDRLSIALTVCGGRITHQGQGL